MDEGEREQVREEREGKNEREIGNEAEREMERKIGN
jgi:hypothetical protein